jgi:hypothetical protein
MNAYRILVGKPEGKRPLGRLGRRWKTNINMDLKREGIVIWLRIGTSLAKMVINRWVP